MKMWKPDVKTINMKPGGGSELLRRSALGHEMMLGESSCECPHIFQMVSLDFRGNPDNISAQTLGFEIPSASVLPYISIPTQSPDCPMGLEMVTARSLEQDWMDMLCLVSPWLMPAVGTSLQGELFHAELEVLGLALGKSQGASQRG